MRSLHCLVATIIGTTAVVASLAACGSSSSPNSDTADAAPASDGATADGRGDGYTALIEGSWTVPSATEGYVCVVKTIDHDMYVGAFSPEIPLGTHHTVLSRFTPSQPIPDGTYIGDGLVPQGTNTWCSGFTAGSNMIFGSGVGTTEFEFPAGVAVKLNAGEQIVLNLHLFNTTDGDLNGTSGTLIKEIPAAQVQHEAEIVLMGPILALDIPASSVSVNITGTCTIRGQAVHLFSVAPHMHQLGTHLQTQVMKAGQMATIYDKDYSFDEQVAQHLSPEVVLEPGDKVITTCTYDNTTQNSIHFGEHTEDEMCFSSIFYWPAVGHIPYCDDAVGG